MSQWGHPFNPSLNTPIKVLTELITEISLLLNATIDPKPDPILNYSKHSQALLCSNNSSPPLRPKSMLRKNNVTRILTMEDNSIKSAGKQQVVEKIQDLFLWPYGSRTKRGRQVPWWVKQMAGGNERDIQLLPKGWQMQPSLNALIQNKRQLFSWLDQGGTNTAGVNGVEIKSDLTHHLPGTFPWMAAWNIQFKT